MDPVQQQKLRELVQSNIWIWFGAILAFLAGGFAINWIRKLFRDGAGHKDSNEEVLLEMQELHRRGEISDEEYRSIKSQFRQSKSL